MLNNAMKFFTNRKIFIPFTYNLSINECEEK